MQWHSDPAGLLGLSGSTQLLLGPAAAWPAGAPAPRPARPDQRRAPHGGATWGPAGTVRFVRWWWGECGEADTGRSAQWDHGAQDLGEVLAIEVILYVIEIGFLSVNNTISLLFPLLLCAFVRNGILNCKPNIDTKYKYEFFKALMFKFILMLW